MIWFILITVAWVVCGIFGFGLYMYDFRPNRFGQDTWKVEFMISALVFTVGPIGLLAGLVCNDERKLMYRPWRYRDQMKLMSILSE